jgi:hypothetical protein
VGKKVSDARGTKKTAVKTGTKQFCEEYFLTTEQDALKCKQ